MDNVIEENAKVESAVFSPRSARSGQPEDGTERLKLYRWKKGNSGNPGGRPRKLPISDGLRLMAEMPLPEKFRLMLEKVIGEELPKKLTFLEGFTFAQMCRGWAPDILKGFDVAWMKDLREAMEGKTNIRIQIPGEELSATADEGMDNRDRIILRALNMMKRRSEMYDLEVPILEEAAAELAQSDSAAGATQVHEKKP